MDLIQEMVWMMYEIVMYIHYLFVKKKLIIINSRVCLIPKFVIPTKRYNILNVIVFLCLGINYLNVLWYYKFNNSIEIFKLVSSSRTNTNWYIFFFYYLIKYVKKINSLYSTTRKL